MLAPYATRPERGRRHDEPGSATRGPFQRDRDRIIHSTAFRRLRYKTQVFVAPDGDHFRVRLTHSLEVAQIARTLARALRLDEDLTEALALAHDLGHPPFGHSGEDALEAVMAPWGGFDHNAQTVRIVTRLECRYPGWDGLNLCWETLEGLAKHNGPIYLPGWAMAAADADWPLDLSSHAGLEAQVAAIADDIAYDNHDLDDGIRAGLFSVDEVAEAVPFTADTLAAVRTRWPGVAARRRLVPEVVRAQIGRMTDDLLEETRRRLTDLAPANASDVRAAGRTLVGLTPNMAAQTRVLKDFLRSRMYRHPRVVALRDPSQEVVADVFRALHANPEALPQDWQAAMPADEPARARHVGDFVAGMTDRFALRVYERLVGPSPLPEDVLL
ncbi:dGTPase [Polymorphobacter multimanifer]|uniref:Deoxyguanosinetriphosphate triphosphohydrolase-like protein n=1 Tax=Polymorphobacter multimanifer TaxID=1070431 RepID=A0A841LI58_9SPHN|nr:deoxyguanosinetriphosphate triphosphohydrolase [Polymorphobacter multimanifer]MBB6228658.1 dGTPase [Polymorphobacter multimanifer]